MLVEEFIPGREFNVGLIQVPELRVLPVSEVLFLNQEPGRWPIVAAILLATAMGSTGIGVLVGLVTRRVTTTVLLGVNVASASFLLGGGFTTIGGQSRNRLAALSTATGLATITVVFKEFGVKLQFTPTIIDTNHVILRVRPEVSQLSTAGATTINGFSIPALTVRRAETTVELGSGESSALAGLLQNTTSQNVSKVPGLGDIPILGQLFRSDQFQRNETELVIVVTPYLVKPTETALALPTDGYHAPHDIQRVVNSDTYRQTLPPPAKGPLGPGNTGLVGPAGFRLD